MKDNKVVSRTKKVWDEKYARIGGCSLWKWLGKGKGWELVKENRDRSKLLMESSMCITEADRILYRINMKLEEIHRKSKIGVT